MGERLTAGEVCTRAVTIAFRATSLNTAARLMRENHVGCLVVVDEVDGRRPVVGMLTDRDIVTSVLACDLDIEGLCVADVMTANPATAREDDSLIDLMRAMGLTGVRRIPVVGEGGTLIGLASLDDVLEILVEELGLLVAAMDSGGRRERRMRK